MVGCAAVAAPRDGCCGGATAGLLGAATGRAGARPPPPLRPPERGILKTENVDMKCGAALGLYATVYEAYGWWRRRGGTLGVKATALV